MKRAAIPLLKPKRKHISTNTSQKELEKIIIFQSHMMKIRQDLEMFFYYKFKKPNNPPRHL